MGKYNDININKWKDYDDILTDSLWLFEKRDNSGLHKGDYHGNFIPQIPHQLFLRYTKKNDWILDCFMGSGTSLIEARELGRNSIGIDLNAELAKKVKNKLKNNPSKYKTKVYAGDSQVIDIKPILRENNIKNFQFIIMHPPYWDIIKFSKKKNDLSNSKNINDFLEKFGKIIDNTTKYLDKGKYCGLVIGDKYADGKIIPLSSLCMNLFIEKGFSLKGIIVKNIGETKGKHNQHNIWRYRALANDFYVFKHEYIYVFKK